MQKIRKGDEVVVITGRDKGKRGTVLRRIDEQQILVEGVHVVKKHVRPNPMKGETGGIVDKTMPINRSNVMLFNPATGKGDRVGIRILEDGTKVRFSSPMASRSRPDRAAMSVGSASGLSDRHQATSREENHGTFPTVI